jgi:omega-amidase
LDSLKVMLVQAELRWQDAAANRDHLNDLMDAGPGADLYVLPETFSTGFLGDVGQTPETMDGATTGWMREQAASRSAAIAGSLALADGGERFNRFLFVTKDGVLAQYDKRHLFSYGGEDQRYRAGNLRTILDWQGWRIDLQTCYDLRFPVWCRNSPEQAFDLQIFVANWPTPRVEAWRSLLKARAIENQSYVIGVNRTGRDGNNVSYPGRSSAWSPMGECLSELDDTEANSVVTLDLNQLRETRQRFPFLQDADRFTLTL